MSDGRNFTHTIPAQPIVRRPHHPKLEPQALVDKIRPRSHRTRRRIMYLVGLITQAAVLGGVVAGLLAFQAPVRTALGLPEAEASLRGAVEALDAQLLLLSARVDALTVSVGAEVPAAGRSLASRIDRIDAVVSRLEVKMDDVRDSTLFPARADTPEP